MGADLGISPDRLIALTDGVYAIAITLLILGLALPEVEFANDYGLINFLISQSDFLITVVISFIVLGDYWIQQHQILQIDRVNIPFLWLNIIYLLIMMFIPFTCSLIGIYGEYKISQILFGLSILLTSIMSLLIYFYAYKADLLIKQERIQVGYTLKSIISLIIITVIIIFLIYIVGSKAILLFLLLPVSSAITGVYYDKKIKEMEETKKEELIDKTKKGFSYGNKEMAKSKEAVKNQIFSNMEHEKLGRLENMIGSFSYEYIMEYVEKNGENLTPEDKLKLEKEAADNLKSLIDSKITKENQE